MTDNKQDRRIYTLSQEQPAKAVIKMGKPQYAFGITLVRQLFLYVPLLLILNRVFGFGGMICAQPITEFIMMIVSVWLLTGVITRSDL